MLQWRFFSSFFFFLYGFFLYFFFISCSLYLMLSFRDVENIGGFLVRSVSSCLEQVPATSTRPVCSRQWDPGLYIAGGWP